jgi:hypothetical protein
MTLFPFILKSFSEKLFYHNGLYWAFSGYVKEQQGSKLGALITVDESYAV